MRVRVRERERKREREGERKRCLDGYNILYGNTATEIESEIIRLANK